MLSAELDGERQTLLTFRVVVYGRDGIDTFVLWDGHNVRPIWSLRIHEWLVWSIVATDM
jgi:hypothetical protein